MAHNRKVLVFKDVNYGASKASATQNTALNPADLADGAVGVYGIHTAGSTNVNKLVLITNGGSEAAGKVPASSFVGKEVFIAQGVPLTAGGSAVRLSNGIGISPTLGIVEGTALVYTAPVRGVLRIGYNGTAGTSMNLPAVINRGDDCIVELFNRNYLVSGAREPGQKVILSSQPAQGDNQYTVLKKFVAAVNARVAANPVGDQILIDPLLLKILSNGTGSAFANSATVALTNGSTAVTTSAVHSVTAGDYIILNGDLYIASAVPTTTTITLDRPWQQATIAALANNLTVDVGATAPTAMGLELVDNADGRNVSAAVQGDFQNATILRYTLPQPGSGSNAEVVSMEKEFVGNKGSEDQITRYMPLDVIYSQVAGSTYDLYFFKVRNFGQATGDPGAVFRIFNIVITAFVSGVANSANKNQADFEDVMQSLFNTTLVPSIS